MAQRAYNFSPGPAALPLPVIQQVQRDLLELPGVGASVLEISHRGDAFKEILSNCQRDLRALLNLTDEHEILFLQGGSRLQFSMVPMNLLTSNKPTASYVLTGSWGKKALQQAEKHGPMHTAWDGTTSRYTTLPQPGELVIDPNSAYVHFTSNETIEGVQFDGEPYAGATPLVCDASSDFLHRPLDMSKYGLLYACAQKNAGPAGVTIVIIRKELLSRSDDGLPGMLDYRNFANESSLYNTPPTFAIYVVGLVCRWLLDEVGGLDAMHQRNQEKAALLYDVLDASDGFYAGHAKPECRSLMNAVFCLPSDELTKRFTNEAHEAGLHALKGHRSVGGIRASIYNAMPNEGVTALRDFMQDFRKKNG